MDWNGRDPDEGGEVARSGPDGALVRALRFNEADRHDLAERALHEGLAQSPDDADLHAELGRTFLLQQRAGEAERAAREALAFAPDHAVARSVLGGALTELGRHAEAERVLIEALREDPEAEHLLFQYALLLHRVGRVDKAEQVLRRALAIAPEDPDAHQLLSVILAERRQRGAALDHGEKGLALGPDAASAHVVQGIALFQNGHPFRAREHLREALRRAPSPEVEELFRNVDTLCRPPGLPLYWWGQLCERVPGKQITVWVGFVLAIQLARSAGVPTPWIVGVSLGYLALALYTWLGFPLARLWARLLPSR